MLAGRVGVIVIHISHPSRTTHKTGAVKKCVGPKQARFLLMKCTVFIRFLLRNDCISAGLLPPYARVPFEE